MLKGSNKISLYNTQIGDKDKTVKAEYNLPLKMGIYVLTDKNGLQIVCSNDNRILKEWDWFKENRKLPTAWQ